MAAAGRSRFRYWVYTLHVLVVNGEYGMLVTSEAAGGQESKYIYGLFPLQPLRHPLLAVRALAIFRYLTGIWGLNTMPMFFSYFAEGLDTTVGSSAVLSRLIL